MAASVVGLDIGSRALRAVEIGDSRKPRPTLLRYHEVVLPEGAVSRGEVLEPVAVTAALKQLWSEGKFKSKDVVLGMGNHRVVARELTVPKMSIARIRESLPFHVEELLSVPVAEALLDFYPISEGEGETGPEVNGLLIAAVAEAVRGNVKAVQAARLIPVGVDLIPFALSRLMHRGAAGAAEMAGASGASGSGGALGDPTQSANGGAVAQIDVGAGTTTVVISIRGVPQFVRLIPTGGQDLTQALTIRLSIEADDAESLKRAVGLTRADATSSTREASLLIREVTQELLNSLRNTVSYFTNTRNKMPVQRIVLSGGGADLTGFAAELSALTRLPVIAPESPNFVDYGKDSDAAAFARSKGSYSVALGLALGSAA